MNQSALNEDRDDIDYELVIDRAGGAILTCGGDVLWSSDADDEYAEEFGSELIEYEDDEQTGRVVAFLIDEGYLPPGTPVDIVEDDSEETGNYPALDDAEER